MVWLSIRWHSWSIHVIKQWVLWTIFHHQLHHMSRWFTWSEHRGHIYTLISWRIMLVDGQHSLFPSPCPRPKVQWRLKHTVWQVCTHPQTDHCSGSVSSVYALHTKLNWNSCELLARDYSFFQKIGFSLLSTLAELLSSWKESYSSHIKILCFLFLSGTPSQRKHRHRLFI